MPHPLGLGLRVARPCFGVTPYKRIGIGLVFELGLGLRLGLGLELGLSSSAGLDAFQCCMSSDVKPLTLQTVVRM